MHLVIAAGCEHQACSSRDQPAFDVRRGAGALDALADQAEIVAETDLPLNRSAIQIVGRQCRVRRADDRRVKPEPFRHVTAFFNGLARAATTAADFNGLEESNDCRSVDADVVDRSVVESLLSAAPL